MSLSAGNALLIIEYQVFFVAIARIVNTGIIVKTQYYLKFALK